MYAGLQESIDPWVDVELRHGKSTHRDNWGRRVIQAIDLDDCIALFEVFQYPEKVSKDTNVKHIDVQTNIYGYGEYLWTRKIHQYIGDTALHLAMKQKKMKCVHMLLVLNADWTIKNEAMMTADDLCNQTLDTDLTNLRFDSEKYILNNLNPTLFHRLPDKAIYRSLQKEAWDLMQAGRILYSELPASFHELEKNNLALSYEEKRNFLSFNLDPDAQEVHDDDASMEGKYHIKRNKNDPKVEKKKASTGLKRQWTKTKDDRGKSYYYDQTTGDSTYTVPKDLYTSQFIPLLSPEQQASQDYDTFRGRFSHDEAAVAAFQAQVDEVRATIEGNSELNTAAKKLKALQEIQQQHEQQRLKKDGSFWARYVEMLRLRGLVAEKVTAMHERSRRSSEQERRGYSLTPGATAVGDVWSRGAISDIIQLVVRQSERRRHAETDSGVYTARGLSLLTSVKQRTASERVLEQESRLWAGERATFQDTAADGGRGGGGAAAGGPGAVSSGVEKHAQEGLKRLRFLKMGQQSLGQVRESLGRTHALPLSIHEEGVNSLSPSKRLVSSVSDKILQLNTTAGSGGVGGGASGALNNSYNSFSGSPGKRQGSPTVRDSFGPSSGRLNAHSPSGRGLVYDPLSHMHTVDYSTAREITTLSTLSNLKYLKIGDAGLTDLSAVLVDDQIIRSLNLSNARVSSEGVSYLADVIPTMRALTHLDLSCNLICNEGAQALATAFTHEECVSLEKLVLTGNRIGLKGCMTLVQEVFNSPVTWLSVSNNLLNKEDIQMMQKLLEELDYGPKPEVERTVTERRTGRNKKILPRGPGGPPLALAYVKKPSMHLGREITVRYGSTKASSRRRGVDDSESSQGGGGVAGGDGSVAEEEKSKREDEEEGDWGDGIEEEYESPEGSKTIVL